MNNTSRLEKIRALLAKAEGTNHPEEAKAFSAKAQELMTKWSIDEAMLSQGKEDSTIDQTLIWIDANEYRGPKLDLLQRITMSNDCKVVLHRQQYREVDGKPKRMFAVAVIGGKTDRDFVEILFSSLLLQATHELLKPENIAKMQFECTHGGHSIKWKNTFVNGYAYSVGNKLREAKERIVEEVKKQQADRGVGMAMVFVGKKALVERKMHEFYPHLKKGSASSAGNGSSAAFSAGREAGNRADLGNPKIAQKNRKALA